MRGLKVILFYYMENLTLKELFPEMSPEDRSALGYALKSHGVQRIGAYVKEDDYEVRKYNSQDFNFIVKFAIKFFRNERGV